ncbi:MAG: adenylate/guanylate cyclase domain-containing protein [Spirochaetales bacterium]|nr:adenylate/guanylate cyclase domain-containing protein [Spirochaetales bacterium]
MKTMYYKDIKIDSRYFLLISLLFGIVLFSCDNNAITASKGIETVETIDKRTYLINDWRIFYGDKPDFAQPDFDDSRWESIDFPQTGFNFQLEKSRFFWLRKSFYVSESLKDRALGYACGKLPDSTEVFFNGALIGTSGHMPPEHYFPIPQQPNTYLLPDKLVLYSGKNVIAFRVYSERNYGDLKLGFITNNEDRLNVYAYQYFINILIPMIMVYFSAIVAAYFLLMFVRNRSDLSNLYLCLAIIGIAIYSSSYFITLPVEFLFGFKIWYICLLLALLFFVFYFQSFYSIHSHWIIQTSFAVFFLACCIILVCMKTVGQAYTLVYKYYYIGIFAPVLLYIGFLSIMAIKKGNKYAAVLLAGVSILILASIHDMVYTFIEVEAPMWLSNTGFVLFILFLFLSNANRFVDTKKEVDNLNIELTQQKDAFFRFVPTQFLSLLGKRSAVDIGLGDSSKKSMSVLFSDIRKFTTISEEKSPEESFHLLNSYLLRMESPISDNEGFVDKYIGDAIMALFSEGTEIMDQITQKTSADRAIMAGIGMRQQLDDFNKNQAFDHMDVLNMGIGINTGPLMLGTVGGTHRLDTTVIGDSVNLAFRLEKLTQFYRSSIIISEWTYKNLTNPDSILIREIDLVIVKGKTESCRIFEVFEADPDDIKELKHKTRDIIQIGIQKYKNRKFKDALTYFKEAKSVYPKDIIPLLYIKRCVEYIKSPPPPNWTGIFKVHA